MSNAERTGPRANPAGRYDAAIDDITARGAAALRDTKAGIEDVVADVSETGREALQGARDVRDSLAGALLDAIKTRPYTTLAIAGLIGFAYGALRRR
jgi:ElaB/YqjD/DUF883 family membrane-anchored ribosome-binding protein